MSLRIFIFNKLKKLNPIRKITGLDGIDVRFLRYGAIKLKLVITFIANLSISANEVLTELKQVRVRPIYKKDDRL